VTTSRTSSLTLTANLRPAALDARRGVVRLHSEVLAALGLASGAPVRLTGRRTSAGVAVAAEGDASRALLYADDLILGNLGVRDGAQVTVEPAPVAAARTVTVSGPAATVAVVSPEMLRLALLGKVVTDGDNVSLLPQDVTPTPARPPIEDTRRSLSNTVGMGWTAVLLTVTHAEPAEAAIVTMDTVVAWDGGQATHSSATPPPIHSALLGGPAGRRASGVAGEARAGHAGSGAGGAAGSGRGRAGRAGTGGGGIGMAGTAGAGAGATDATTGLDTEPAPNLDDLAGLRSQAQELTELLDLGFNHTEILDRLGTQVSLGILVTGPAGSGKSTLVRAVAHHVDADVVTVWAPEVAALTVNDAAARLRDAAALAERVGTDDDSRPAVLLVSDVDSLVAKSSPGPLSTVFRQIIAATLKAGVAVVCTTSRPEEVDPALRGPDLLEHEIGIPLPDASDRRELLTVLTRNVRLADDVRLDEVAARTPGFVAADLYALVREAGVRAAVRHRNTLRNGGRPTSDTEPTEPAQPTEPAGSPDPAVGAADFRAALEVVRPSSMAESSLEVGDVSLDDVGDMADVKQVLTESVLWPLTYPDTFARLGIEPPRGVLLYGPPGCGKTYLVKAIAGQGRANVLSVKGAELLSKWVGDSERAVRELFRRARDAAPTLVFLDEVDALAPVRGQATDGGTTDRVVASLLTELDGVESLRHVVVIGATNRPDLVDPALRRPGRLERMVYVPPPDTEARTAILTAAARRVPLAPDVDLAALAADLDGFSSADCAALIREAALVAMRESLTAAEVTAAHVRTARTNVHPSLDPAQVTWLSTFANQHTSS
jgi:transitional endoplasmic reticulum ATPase